MANQLRRRARPAGVSQLARNRLVASETADDKSAVGCRPRVERIFLYPDGHTGGLLQKLRRLVNVRPRDPCLLASLARTRRIVNSSRLPAQTRGGLLRGLQNAPTASSSKKRAAADASLAIPIPSSCVCAMRVCVLPDSLNSLRVRPPFPVLRSKELRHSMQLLFWDERSWSTESCCKPRSVLPMCLSIFRERRTDSQRVPGTRLRNLCAAVKGKLVKCPPLPARGGRAGGETHRLA